MNGKIRGVSSFDSLTPSEQCLVIAMGTKVWKQVHKGVAESVGRWLAGVFLDISSSTAEPSAITR